MPDSTETAQVAKRSRKKGPSNPNRGSKPGERRGGRAAGTPNKVGRELREAARQYTDEALAVLVQVAQTGESDAARVSAANAILDRGYGKPSQPIDGDGDGGAIQTITRILLEGVAPE